MHALSGVVCEYNSHCTHNGFVPGYCLSQILKESDLKKEMETTSMRTRALPSQLPVGLRRMTWAPRCLVIFRCKYLLKIMTDRKSVV